MQRLALFAFGFLLTLPIAIHAHSHKSHVHGEGKLELTIDRNSVVLNLELPLDAVVGFEHAPGNDKERAALKAAESVLNDAAALWLTTPAANCRIRSVSVDMPGFADGEHADLAARYEFQCEVPESLQGIETTIFKHFKGLYRLETQRVGPAGQGAQRLSPRNALLRW